MIERALMHSVRIDILANTGGGNRWAGGVLRDPQPLVIDDDLPTKCLDVVEDPIVSRA
ncbi:MAG: hypothetical protein ACRDRN_06535 [Sciscionella sp.]